MKKYLIAIVAVIALAFSLVGCGKHVFTLEIDPDGAYAQFTGENTDKGDMAMSGSLVVDEDSYISIDYNIEKGSIQVRLFGSPQAGQDADFKDVVDAGEPIVDETFKGSDVYKCDVPAGSYMIEITTPEKTTGLASFTSGYRYSPENWGPVDTAEAAAAAAGVTPIVIPDGLTISLGPVAAYEYAAMNGVAQTHAPAAAVEMFIRKGAADAGDITYDRTEYANTWTQQVGDIEVTCKGNRDGAATVSTWKTADASYAILAYGAGGDDDYGLPAEDVATLVTAIK